jgi:hypothetical protein
MPIHKIEVLEYECAKCGYKWINRYNGKDGPKPKRCAKCKHKFWEQGLMSEQEKSWRRQLIKWHYTPNCMEFLNTVPRPTIKEIMTVIYDIKKEYEKTIGQRIRLSEESLYPELTDMRMKSMQKLIDSRK